MVTRKKSIHVKYNVILIPNIFNLRLPESKNMEPDNINGLLNSYCRQYYEETTSS